MQYFFKTFTSCKLLSASHDIKSTFLRSFCSWNLSLRTMFWGGYNAVRTTPTATAAEIEIHCNQRCRKNRELKKRRVEHKSIQKFETHFRCFLVKLRRATTISENSSITSSVLFTPISSCLIHWNKYWWPVGDTAEWSREVSSRPVSTLSVDQSS